MWQPIETAPKDGSSILLATPKGRIADGFWGLHYKVWSWPYIMVEPTHWMPLPVAPGAQAQPAPSVLVDLTPLESVQYWADAYGNPMGDEHFLGHGVAARLLREYVNLRAMLAASPEIKP